MRPSWHEQMPSSLTKALRKFGADLSIARRKRRMTAAEVAAAAGISEVTLWRLERGDPGVGLGVVAMVLLALGEQSRIGDLIDVSKDDTGLLLDTAKLPKRVRRTSKPQAF